MKKKRRLGLILAIVIPVGVLLSIALCIVGYYSRAIEVIDGFIHVANFESNIADSYNPDYIDYDDLVRLRVVDDDFDITGSSFRSTDNHKIKKLSVNSADFEVFYMIKKYESNGTINYNGHWVVRMEFVDFDWRVVEVEKSSDG